MELGEEKQNQAIRISEASEKIVHTTYEHMNEKLEALLSDGYTEQEVAFVAVTTALQIGLLVLEQISPNHDQFFRGMLLYELAWHNRGEQLKKEMNYDQPKEPGRSYEENLTRLQACLEVSLKYPSFGPKTDNAL